MATKGKKPKAAAVTKNGGTAKSYGHPEAEAVMRPEIGTQAQFKKKKEPKKYRYDSSLSPSLEWDGQNPAREQSEALIKEILDAKSIEQAKAAADKVRKLSKPFLNWAGKAERLSFDVPTLPMFVHERLSTKAILETLKGHKRDKQLDMFDLYGDPGHSITDQVLKAYEHKDRWVNRMILGDSLVVMNSLLQYEGMGGKIQTIYMDPPYGVRFGSNFQPFVRKRDVSHGDDDDMTREPEMVQAYRDTWELGLHSYLTYMRDRLILCRELLSTNGSIFVQISDDNVHHVREVMDEVFGSSNFVVEIAVQKTGSQTGAFIQPNADYLLWYTKDKPSAESRFHRLFVKRRLKSAGGTGYNMVELPDGSDRPLTAEEFQDLTLLPLGSRVWSAYPLTSDGYRPTTTVDFHYRGRVFHPGPNRHWGVTTEDLSRVGELGRLVVLDNQIRLKRYFDDFPIIPLSSYWDDVGGASDRQYVVQTSTKVIERCVLMTTEPGDLIFDPTCGSGTTAFVGENWGRRWITADVSRVPLALARQRLLTATFPWYELKDDARGPSGGFVYKRKQNSRGEETGGVVPHVTLKSIAREEQSGEEVLVDRPELKSAITRVTGPFCVESPIPASTQLDADSGASAQLTGETTATFVERMLEVLRKSPVLHTGDNKTLTLKSIRPPAKALTLSAEGVAVNGEERNVAFVFGPENGSVTESLVFEAAREAYIKGYAHLFVIGFAIEAKARMFVQKCGDVVGIPATYVQATTDLTMSDLLKTMRSSQIFSVCGLPEVNLYSEKSEDGTVLRVQLLGLDVFDPVTMQAEHYKGDDAAESDKVPAWFLDTDYNGLCFHVSQAFFPRTAAWDSLKRALKGTYDDSVWDHLAGTISEPFEPGNHKQIAVKVIDDRGNELLVVKSLSEAVKQTAQK